MKILVTGGAGFIGCHLVRYLIKSKNCEVLNVDSLTYAGNLLNLADLHGHTHYRFAKVCISDLAALNKLFADFSPDAVMHLAAESHVDRSIEAPFTFIETNIIGTFTLLQAARSYFEGLTGSARDRFRFLHVSTDEVYGSLGPSGRFTETSAYSPSSPYAASKAASDHLVRAWANTYGLPVIVTHSSNNYGPNQYPEKLIPAVICRALQGQPILIFGDGSQIRDWLYVGDHVEALYCVLIGGQVGESYNIGGNHERKNLDLVHYLCAVLDELHPRQDGFSYTNQITFTIDRPGHDFRYALDTGKIEKQVGWSPKKSPEIGFRETVQWYLATCRQKSSFQA